MHYPEKIDLHMHTTVSDGTDTPEEILANVKEAEIELFSVTDHDAVKAGPMIRDLLKEGDPLFLTGAEFSCKDEEGKYHILGYGFDPDSEAIRQLVDLGHGYRMDKVNARLDFLRDEFNFVFPQEELNELLSMDNPGKPHIGNLMVKMGYAPTKEIAIKEYINKVRFPNKYVRPEEAIEGILGGGGVPVLAHPSYGNGDDIIVGQEMDQRLRKLIDFGLEGVEVFYSGFTDKLRSEMLSFAEKYDLYITAGSDYHGSNKLVVLGDTGCDNAAEGPQGMRRFLDRVLNSNLR